MTLCRELEQWPFPPDIMQNKTSAVAKLRYDNEYHSGRLFWVLRIIASQLHGPARCKEIGILGVATVAFLAIGAVLLMLALHPVTTYPLSLMLLSRFYYGKAFVRPSRGLEAVSKPTLAICMSAYNEELVIADKVEALIAAARRYGNATVHVFADAPSDATADILKRYADRIDLVVSHVREGKTAGMNRLVARTESDLLLFTDANVVSEADSIEHLAAAFADPEVGCASARLVYNNPVESAASKTGASYWAVEEAIKAIESETTGLIGVDGAMFMMRRSLYRAPSPMLIDDLTLSLTVLIEGARLVSVPDAVVYERSAISNREEFLRKQRIACQAMNVHRSLWPQLKKLPPLKLYAYVSHRLLKWLTPFLVLFGALALIIAGALSLGLSNMVVGLMCLAVVVLIGERLHVSPLPLLFSVATNLTGVGLGVLQSIFMNKSYVAWDPAISVRQGVGVEKG